MSILREGRGHCLFFFHGPSNTESQKCLFNFYLYLVWGCRKLPGPTLLPVSMELTGAVSGSKENVRSREGAEVGAVIMVRIEAVDQRDKLQMVDFLRVGAVPGDKELPPCCRVSQVSHQMFAR